jgi:hypothetical protein
MTIIIHPTSDDDLEFIYDYICYYLFIMRKAHDPSIRLSRENVPTKKETTFNVLFLQLPTTKGKSISTRMKVDNRLQQKS